MADEEGFLIIDEVAAVGMMRSFMNFAEAGTGKFTYFFESPTVPELKKNHMHQVEEMIVRDKNHPSVIAFSFFNEPETTSDAAAEYFRDIFEAARKSDPQCRPLTGAMELFKEEMRAWEEKYLEKTFEVIDQFPFVQGNLDWNFADFQTQENIARVNGNKKGIFTRNRQPKNAAYVLKRRWEQ